MNYIIYRISSKMYPLPLRPLEGHWNIRPPPMRPCPKSDKNRFLSTEPAFFRPLLASLARVEKGLSNKGPPRETVIRIFGRNTVLNYLITTNFLWSEENANNKICPICLEWNTYFMASVWCCKTLSRVKHKRHSFRPTRLTRKCSYKRC